MSFFRKSLKGKEAEARASESAVATSALSKPIFPDGIKQLYPPSGTAMDDAEVDICFVHGLTGDREKTWTADKQSAPWPQTLLPSVFPKARILTFGYDAYVVQSGVASANGLDCHATNLLNDLVGDRQDCRAKSRPLIFVAHSLGGIVCKQAISFSQRSKHKHLQDIYNSVIGIAFMGAPHRGSSLANWASIPATVLGVVKSVNQSLTDVLRIGDPLLKRTYDEFLDTLAGRHSCGKDIEVVCFYEELPVFKNLKVVTEHSAAMDGVIAMSIHANHSDMVRFSSNEDNGFVRLRRELSRWIDDVKPPNSAEADHAETTRADDLINDPKNTGCIQDLFLTDPDDDRTRIEKKNGTFFESIHDWVFSNESYKQWKEGNSQSRLLWIQGDPGKGKTMILCSIIRKLEKSKTPLSYFFCQATNEQLNHATAVLRGLIYAFIKKQPALVVHVRKKYDLTGRRLFEGVNAWEALTKIFADMINDDRLAEAVVLVDGLDECTTGRSQLLNLIAQPSHVRWLVSSRNWPEIREGLRGAEQKAKLCLELNPDTIAKAVDAYIVLKVNHLASKKSLEPETENALKQHLVINADGTFLWVALVCHALESVSRRNFRKELTTFPRGLSALYDRMMQNIQEADDADECREILAIASTVYRPITLAELQVLCPSLLDLNKKDLEEAIQFCGSFLTLRDDALYFVHQSAKDYLVGEAQPQIFPRGLGSRHHVIASRSLAAISGVLRRDIYGLEHPGYAIEMVKPPADDPLAPVAYSCRFWVDHLAEAETSQRNVSLQDGEEVHRFLLTKFLYWLEALSLLQSVLTGAGAVHKLHAMMSGKKQELVSFTYDAQRFISTWAHVIAMAPLQTYASALVFSPQNSKVRKQFAQEESNWVSTGHKAHAEWDACVHTLEGLGGVITALAFSPDGLRLAVAVKTVKVWDVLSGQCTLTLKGEHDFWRVAFSPDGQKLLTYSTDTAVTIWDLAGRILQTLDFSLAAAFVQNDLEIAGGKLSSCNFATLPVEISPSGELAAGSRYGEVLIWDSSGQPRKTLRDDADYITLIAFSPDSRRLASVSNCKTVKVWDVTSCQCVWSLENFDETFISAALSSDGLKLALGSNNRSTRVWDLPAYCGQEAKGVEKCAHTIEDPDGLSVVAVAFSPDGRRLASSSRFGLVKIWDLDGQPGEMHTDHIEPVARVVFSPKGQFLASCSQRWQLLIKIWDAVTRNLVQEIEGGVDVARRFGFLPGEQFLAVESGYDGSVSIWNVATGTLTEVLKGEKAKSFDLRAKVQGNKPTHRCLGFSARCDWITAHGENLLWLPPEYRPTTKGGQGESYGRMVGIGTARGQVLLFHFAPVFGIC